MSPEPIARSRRLIVSLAVGTSVLASAACSAVPTGPKSRANPDASCAVRDAKAQDGIAATNCAPRLGLSSN